MRGVTLEDIFKKHKTWIEIVSSFVCNKETSEDIVQEMYIKIYKKLLKGLDIRYNKDDFNYYYIFLTLKTLFFDLKRKEKNINIIDINEIKNYSNEISVNYTEAYDLVQKELDKMYWYNKKVFEIIEGGESIAKLSRKTGIAYHSLYNTYTKVKKNLKKLL